MASLPLPINITEQKIESTMVADYKLHGAGLAFNEQRTRFAILNKDKLSSCSVQGLQYCQFGSALYSVATTKKYPIHLFLHSKDKIKKYCHKTVVPNVVLPTGINVIGNLWLFTTTDTLRFSLRCRRGSNVTLSSLVSRSGVDILQVPVGCIATGDTLSLTSHYVNNMHYKITSDLVNVIRDNLSVSRAELWQNFC
jgi:hypothetical protein